MHQSGITEQRTGQRSHTSNFALANASSATTDARMIRADMVTRNCVFLFLHGQPKKCFSPPYLASRLKRKGEIYGVMFCEHSRLPLKSLSYMSWV